MLEAALAAGIAAAGGDALLGGVLPTPAASILVRRHGLDLGAVVSASHNPWRDNGIKFFGRRRRASSTTTPRRAIEERVDAGAGAAERVGRVRTLEGALDDYLRELDVAPSGSTSAGRAVLLDCANGATYRAAPAAFERLGADVEAVADEPDGRNINDGCGSTHLEALAERDRASPAPRSASPSTATATACSPSTATARVHDGDEMIALARAPPARLRARSPGASR